MALDKTTPARSRSKKPKIDEYEQMRPRRSEFIHVRVTPEEKGALSIIAVRRRRTVSELIRAALLPTADKRQKRAS